MARLTSEEIDILFDALDAWEKEPGRDGLLSSVMGALVMGDKEGKSKEYMDNTMKDAEYKERSRKRKAILLKAKLVKMSEDTVATELFNKGS